MSKLETLQPRSRLLRMRVWTARQLRRLRRLIWLRRLRGLERMTRRQLKAMWKLAETYSQLQSSLSESTQDQNSQQSKEHLQLVEQWNRSQLSLPLPAAINNQSQQQIWEDLQLNLESLITTLHDSRYSKE